MRCPCTYCDHCDKEDECLANDCSSKHTTYTDILNADGHKDYRRIKELEAELKDATTPQWHCLKDALDVLVKELRKKSHLWDYENADEYASCCCLNRCADEINGIIESFRERVYNLWKEEQSNGERT